MGNNNTMNTSVGYTDDIPSINQFSDNNNIKRPDFRNGQKRSFDMGQKSEFELRPKITVFGVGGAGGNAVNNMISTGVEGCDFVIANTDAQAINQSIAEKRIQLGITITRGLGAGSRPDVGRAAAEEAKEEIQEYLYGSNMVFITAGMGGGTGTGAAPVIAKLAKEQGILTIGVVTKPFHFEGTHRMRLAEKGLQELQKFVDTLIVIPNQNLFRVANDKTTFADAFRMADDVLSSGVRGVTDLMVMPGLINLDFADIRSVMSEMGKAMMGTGDSEGEKKAILAAEAAISNPLLDDISMKGARGVLINITGGYDMTLYEVDEAANRIRDEVDPEANIIFGSTFDASMEGRMRVSVVATGIDVNNDDKKVNMRAFNQSFDNNQSVNMSQRTETSEKSVSDTIDNVVSKVESGNVTNVNFQNDKNSESENIASVISSSKPEISNSKFVIEKQKKKSFFSKLSNLISGKKENQSTSALQNHNNIDNVVENLSSQNENMEQKNDDLEIPAFLRRK